jgi:hypothetical protein
MSEASTQCVAEAPGEQSVSIGARLVHSSMMVFNMETHKEIAPFCADLKVPQPPFLIQINTLKLGIVICTKAL